MRAKTLSRERGSVGRFIVVGLANVVVDLSVYSAALFLGAPPSVAKGLAFGAGTLFAFFANRAWTFRAGDTSLLWLAPFLLLYAVNSGVNVGLNSAVLHLLDRTPVGFTAAYLVATGTSALLNYAGMRVIFLRRS